MAGIYIHIPFCKQACFYCDFHFSTNLSFKDEMVEMICREISLRESYLEGEELETIYFGGGTPSLLTRSQIEKIIDFIYTHNYVQRNPEITLEANPDDLDKETLKDLRNSGINRLSIGTQSFHDPHLKYLHRVHNSEGSVNAIRNAYDAGFSNLSIDLIYGIPAENHSIWKKDLETAISLKPPHISSYCLTIEPKTVFGNWLKKGKIQEAPEEFASEQFEILLETLGTAGYEQYEISNFCTPGLYSRHNSNYWKNQKYLGIGPGAHSFNGRERQFNVSNNSHYIKSLGTAIIPATVETLTKYDIVNEYLLTSLRTSWGCDIRVIKETFVSDFDTFTAKISNFIDKNLVIKEGTIIRLTDKGKLLADKITSELFFG